MGFHISVCVYVCLLVSVCEYVYVCVCAWGNEGVGSALRLQVSLVLLTIKHICALFSVCLWVPPSLQSSKLFTVTCDARLSLSLDLLAKDVFLSHLLQHQ